MLYKAVVANVDDIDLTNKTARFRLTDGTRDLVGDVIAVDGLDVRDYLKSNRVLLEHNHQKRIGTCTRLTRTGGALFGTCKFSLMSTPSVETWERVQKGEIRGASVGIQPLVVHKHLDGLGHFIAKSALIEWSITARPCNPAALRCGCGGNCPIGKSFGSQLDHLQAAALKARWEQLERWKELDKVAGKLLAIERKLKATSAIGAR